jgi:mono/diheme cytochrome c family protein
MRRLVAPLPTAFRLATLATALCLTSCGDKGEEEETLSGATCPPDSTLTYESFGRAFMDKYCVACHASTLQGGARQGAPSDHDLDTLEAVRETEAGHIDENAAAGPDRVNDAMPPSTFSPQPSEAERRDLGKWLACGMP